MHLCFPINDVCTISGELKATHVKPSGALALTSLKENNCISGVLEPISDADDLASVLNASLMVENFLLLGFCLLTRMCLLASSDCYALQVAC